MLGQARRVKGRGSYGLRWTEVDVEAQTISIEITRVVVDGEVVEGGTRSETSTRVLAAHPRAVGSAQGRRAHAGRGAARRGPPASAAASWSSTLWAGATTPTRGRTTGRPRVRRRASSASGYTRPAHLRHADAPGAQRAGGVATDLDTEHGGTLANKRHGAREHGRLNVDGLQL